MMTKMTFGDRMREAFRRSRVSEMIGRVATPIFNMVTRQTVDLTKADYAFWSRFRRGKQKTYELGGLFANPIAEKIASYMLGKGIGILCEDEGTQSALSDFVDEALDDLFETVKDSMQLGDAYIVVNPDGTLQRVSPDQVEIITVPEGSQNVVGYRITSVLAKMTIIDEYYAFHRVIKATVAGVEQPTMEFTNPTGLIPVIHFANDPEANELHGHVMYEGLLKLFAEYDDTMLKALDGVKAMGHPLAVIEGAEDPAEEVEANKTGEIAYDNEDGTRQTRAAIDITRLTMLVLGKGATFKFASGAKGFTEDAGRMLEYLFLLMLQHSHVPEWVWGGAINSSKASVDAQTPAWHLFIDWRRRKAAKPIQKLLEVWRAIRALYDFSIDATVPFKLEFPRLDEMTQETLLQFLNNAFDRGVITKATYLSLMMLVRDAESEVAAADEENSGEDAEVERRARAAFDAAQNGSDDEDIDAAA